MARKWFVALGVASAPIWLLRPFVSPNHERHGVRVLRVSRCGLRLAINWGFWVIRTHIQGNGWSSPRGFKSVWACALNESDSFNRIEAIKFIMVASGMLGLIGVIQLIVRGCNLHVRCWGNPCDICLIGPCIWNLSPSVCWVMAAYPTSMCFNDICRNSCHFIYVRALMVYPSSPSIVLIAISLLIPCADLSKPQSSNSMHVFPDRSILSAILLGIFPLPSVHLTERNAPLDAICNVECWDVRRHHMFSCAGLPACGMTWLHKTCISLWSRKVFGFFLTSSCKLCPFVDVLLSLFVCQNDPSTLISTGSLWVLVNFLQYSFWVHMQFSVIPLLSLAAMLWSLHWCLSWDLSCSICVNSIHKHITVVPVDACSSASCPSHNGCSLWSKIDWGDASICMRIVACASVRQDVTHF